MNFEAEIRELVVLELWEDGAAIAYVEGHCHNGISSGSVVDSRGHVNWRGGGGLIYDATTDTVYVLGYFRLCLHVLNEQLVCTSTKATSAVITQFAPKCRVPEYSIYSYCYNSNYS